MSNPNATTRALLGTLVLCCSPVFASTASPDEVRIRIGGGELVAPNHYQVSAGEVVDLAVQAAPGSMIYCFAVAADDWGEPDYSGILTLFLETAPNGTLSASFVIPEELRGRIFYLTAVAADSKGGIHSSSEVTIEVVDRIILLPPPALHQQIQEN
jgi:hypothetical protein